MTKPQTMDTIDRLGWGAIIGYWLLALVIGPFALIPYWLGRRKRTHKTTLPAGGINVNVSQ